jgi:hypothetical protein
MQNAASNLQATAPHTEDNGANGAQGLERVYDLPARFYDAQESPVDSWKNLAHPV